MGYSRGRSLFNDMIQTQNFAVVVRRPKEVPRLKTSCVKGVLG
jgi:hypothetical protein